MLNIYGQLIEDLTYLYRTWRLFSYKDSNVGSLVSDATVRIFSIASVTVWRDSVKTSCCIPQDLWQNDGKCPPFQPSPAPSCPSLLFQLSSASLTFQPQSRLALPPAWGGSAASHAETPWLNWCPCLSQSGSLWPNVVLSPEQRWKVIYDRLSRENMRQRGAPYPLYLSGIWGQPCYERTDTVLGVVKPAEVLIRLKK